MADKFLIEKTDSGKWKWTHVPEDRSVDGDSTSNYASWENAQNAVHEYAKDNVKNPQGYFIQIDVPPGQDIRALDTDSEPSARGPEYDDNPKSGKGPTGDATPTGTTSTSSAANAGSTSSR